jgi:hypothetical protein
LQEDVDKYTEKLTVSKALPEKCISLPWSIFELTSVVIGTDYIGSCKSNYHTITRTTPNSSCPEL